MLRGIVTHGARYTFIMDQRRSIYKEQFLKATKEGLADLLRRDTSIATPEAPPPSESQVETKLNTILAKELLVVTTVEPSKCIVPLVAFDPTLEQRQVYVWDWSIINVERVDNQIARLSHDVAKKWYEDYYLPEVQRLGSVLKRNEVNDAGGSS